MENKTEYPNIVAYAVVDGVVEGREWIFDSVSRSGKIYKYTMSDGRALSMPDWSLMTSPESAIDRNISTTTSQMTNIELTIESLSTRHDELGVELEALEVLRKNYNGGENV